MTLMTVALTSHVMKTFERLVLQLIPPQVQGVTDPLQVAYSKRVIAEDAGFYLLHWALTYLDAGTCL